MSDDLHEPDLRERFARLRAEDSASAPAFSLKRPARAPRRQVPAWAMATAAAASAVAVLWLTTADGNGNGPAAGLDLSTTAWVAPTDFLLETPGRDLLRALPRIGAVGYAAQPVTPEQ